jgi:hypothetical protein
MTVDSGAAANAGPRLHWQLGGGQRAEPSFRPRVLP